MDEGRLPAISLAHEARCGEGGLARRLELRIRSGLGKLTTEEASVWRAYADRKQTAPVTPRIAGVLLPGLTTGGARAVTCAKLIETDPILAAAVLRCANTESFFGRDSTANIRHAIDRLGPDGAAALALTLSSTALYDSDTRAVMRRIGYEYEQLWIGNLELACIARKIAAMLQHPEPDMAYAAGLFHGIGRSLALHAAGVASATDAAVAALAPRARRALVVRLAPAMTAHYLKSHPFCGRIADLVLDVDAPPHAPVGATALVLRLALGLLDDPSAPDTERASRSGRCMGVARTLGLSRAALGRLRALVTRSREDVQTFVTSLSSTRRRAQRRETEDVWVAARRQMTGTGAFAIVSPQPSYHPAHAEARCDS